MKFKFIKKIATVVSVGVLAFTGYNALVNSNDGTESSSSKLGKVTDLSYDNSSFTLDWKDVKNADYYTVNIDGAEYKAEESEYPFIINKEVTEFKVKACSNDIINVFSGDWSDTYTYTMEKEQSTIVNDFLSILDRKNSYGINPQVLSWTMIEDGALEVFSLFDVGDRKKIYSQIFCEDKITENSSLEEIVEIISNSSHSPILNEECYFTDTNYLNDIMDKKLFEGNVKKYYQQGYKISIVNAGVDDFAKDKAEFEIFGIFKAEKDGDVKFIMQDSYVGLKNRSEFPSVNYVNIFNEDKVTKSLLVDKILTGDFEEFAKLYDTALSAQNSKGLEK